MKSKQEMFLENHKEILVNELDNVKQRYYNTRSKMSVPDKCIYETLINLAEETMIFATPTKSSTINENGQKEIFSVDIFKNPRKTKHNKKQIVYRCNVKNCLKSYTSYQGLKYHSNVVHDKNKISKTKLFHCPVSSCFKAYKNPNGLKYHLNTNYHK